MSAPTSHDWLEIRQAGPVTVVKFLQRQMHDEEAIDLVGEELLGLVKNGMRNLALNFEPVRRIATHMLGELLVLHKKVHAVDGRLVLCGFNPELRETFSVLKLDQVFSIFATEEEALESFQAIA
jgi:anti-sigma B factor antagonist